MKQSTFLLFLAACAGSGAASTGKGDINDAEPRKVAEAYLAAMVDPQQQVGKQYLLGGVTLDAKEAKVAEAKLLTKVEPRTEDGSVQDLKARVDALDKAGVQLLTEGSALSHNKEVNLEEAKKLREKTKALRKDLLAKNPVFSDVLRVDRTLYWHPKNPARALLQQGKDGPYHVDYVSFTVESKETASSPAKTWPLRVVRYKAGDVDTGWKVLPASEWDPE